MMTVKIHVNTSGYTIVDKRTLAFSRDHCPWRILEETWTYLQYNTMGTVK